MISKWLSASEISAFTAFDKRLINRRAVNEHWVSRNEKGNGGLRRVYQAAALPEDIQTAYAASLEVSLSELQGQLKPVSTREKKAAIARYNGRGAKTGNVKPKEQIPEKYLEVANARLGVLQTYSASGLSAGAFITAYKAGVIAQEFRERLGPHGDIKRFQSLYRWLERYEQYGIAGLCPQYGGRGGAGASLAEEEKSRIEWLYLNQNKPAAASVIEGIKQYGIELSPSIVYRYINSIPRAIKDLYRNGKKSFHDKNEAYLERDYTLLKSMDAIRGDYMTEDILCRAGEKLARAKLCAFMDMRSRVIVGWSLQLTANSAGVVRALRMCIGEYGTPKAVYVDNGKEFKNYWLCGDTWKAVYTKIDPKTLDLEAGILHECGIAVHFTTPYHGQSKPIERFWRTFHERFDKFCPSYTGSNTSDRPDETKEYRSAINLMKDEEIARIPTFKELEKSIAGFLYWYNTEHHHTGNGMDGKTPMEVMRENAAERREIPAGYEKYVFTEREIKTVQRNGVNLDGIWYYNPKFIGIIGQKVQVRRSIDSINTVSIFSLPDVVYLYDAEGNLLKETGATAEDIRRVNKLRKEAAAIKSKYNQKKNEYDRQGFKTPAELLAETVIEDTREVAGGGPLAVIENAPRAFRRLRLPTGPD